LTACCLALGRLDGALGVLGALGLEIRALLLGQAAFLLLGDEFAAEGFQRPRHDADFVALFLHRNFGGEIAVLHAADALGHFVQRPWR
jgi:hypothetical protein